MNEKYFIEKDDPYIARIIEEVNQSRLLGRFHEKKALHLQRYYEITPGQIVATIAPNQFGNPAYYAMVWGFNLEDPLRVTHSVRIENIEKDKRYSDDYKKHRCVFPASYFVEKKHFWGNDGSVKLGKEYIVQPTASPRTFLCGFYERAQSTPSIEAARTAWVGVNAPSISNLIQNGSFTGSVCTP